MITPGDINEDVGASTSSQRDVEQSADQLSRTYDFLSLPELAAADTDRAQTFGTPLTTCADGCCTFRGRRRQWRSSGVGTRACAVQRDGSPTLEPPDQPAARRRSDGSRNRGLCIYRPSRAPASCSLGRHLLINRQPTRPTSMPSPPSRTESSPQ